jgi:hypothetical protein
MLFSTIEANDSYLSTHAVYMKRPGLLNHKSA